MNKTATSIDGDVVLTFPASTGYLALCRVNVAAVGSILDFDLDVLDDVRLAVTEAVTWLLSGAEEGSNATLRIGSADKTLRFDASCPDSTGSDGDSGLDDLSSAILGATVDSFDATVESTTRRFRFAKAAP